MAEGDVPAAQIMQVPIRFEVPSNLVTRYATNIVAQPGDYEIIISFFEAHPPIIFGPQSVADSPIVPAECVARVAVAAGRLPDFITVLQAALEQHERMRIAKEGLQ